MKKKDETDQLLRDVRVLLNHILMIQRKCRDNNVWLSAGIDPYKPLENDEQQGPLITRMFEMTKVLRRRLNKNK